MKKTAIYLLTILFLFSFSNCNDNNGDNEIAESLNLSETELSFKWTGEKLNFTIESNTKWEIEPITWCTISPLSGEGSMEITVEAPENKESTIISTSVKVKTQTRYKTIKIAQEAAPLQGFYYPLLTINTENKKTIDSKDYYVNATITIESRDDRGATIETLHEIVTEIKGRGNTTWGMEKKPYRLKFDKSTEVLGMPKSKHWVLLANYSDKTLMRNELAFEVSRRMGFAYTPKMKYVDVILNGDYVGNYMLCEHIRIDKNRVNVAELEPTDTDITGGYLLEIDERKGEPVWFETKEAKMIFCVNRPEDIPYNQKEYISNHVQKVEDVLYGKNDVNVVEELPKYIDMKSFIDYLLLNELSKNVDGNLRLSTFVYKDRNNDKLYFGPVWDYDIAFGNVNYDECNYIAGWHARKWAEWYKQFFTHPEFDKMVKDRWKELRSGELNELNTFIDKLAEDMEISQIQNFNRWKILDKAVWPNPVTTGSYSGEVDYLKDWLTRRLNWMDQQLN
jgi:hypothetical protein